MKQMKSSDGLFDKEEEEKSIDQSKFGSSSSESVDRVLFLVKF